MADSSRIGRPQSLPRRPLPSRQAAVRCWVAWGALLSAGVATAGDIDLGNLEDYAAQPRPGYILKDNAPPGNAITDIGATLGRVLFYDKRLSVDGTVACASCHIQARGFGDEAPASSGVAGVTGRHSMRLVNARFGDERRFFWDERAVSLEDQTTRPIQDHVEMGYSGTLGDPTLADLMAELAGIDTYQTLFTMTFGDPSVTEIRMQRALAQFVRSIQSFDTRFDQGRGIVGAEAPPFPNFTPGENQGKQLFLTPAQFDPMGRRIGGGVGCAGCHHPPEFDIDPGSRNNGLVIERDATTNTGITRAPTLRDLFGPGAVLNGPLMHDAGGATTPGDLAAVLDHYDQITPVPNIDPRLTPGGQGQRLNLTAAERDQLAQFLLTLSGSDVYTNPKWSDPFAPNDRIDLVAPDVVLYMVKTPTLAARAEFQGLPRFPYVIEATDSPGSPATWTESATAIADLIGRVALDLAPVAGSLYYRVAAP